MWILNVHSSQTDETLDTSPEEAANLVAAPLKMMAVAYISKRTFRSTDPLVHNVQPIYFWKSHSRLNWIIKKKAKSDRQASESVYKRPSEQMTPSHDRTLSCDSYTRLLGNKYARSGLSMWIEGARQLRQK